MAKLKFKVYGNSKCSCGGPVCKPKEDGRNKRFKKTPNQKGR